MTSDTVVRQLAGSNPPFIVGTSFDLATIGYRQAEYALSGEATAYRRAANGVTPTGRAEYTTRLLVHRPADSSAFNGTVWVEWLNVSGGVDVAAEWLLTHTELTRSGAAWVGVSAQRLGVSGGTGLLGFASPGLTHLDPERYGALHHPGDRFSYDIFSHVGDMVRKEAATLFNGLAVERVLALGGSQSASRLSTYINEFDETAGVYDGYLVHSRGAAIAPLDSDGLPNDHRTGDPVPFPEQLRVPVVCVEAETDLLTLGYLTARQEDAERLVIWEIAGTSHADIYTLVVGFADTGRLPVEQLARLWRPAADPLGMTFDRPVNTGPQHYVLNAAMSWTARWVRDGERPPGAPRLETRDSTFATDWAGNVLGGVRTPHVDVPAAVLSGHGNGGNEMAFLAGTTTPLTADQMRSRYPSKEGYLVEFAEATERAVAAGFLQASDSQEVTAIAAANSPSW